jgi:hypothetical protein
METNSSNPALVFVYKASEQKVVIRSQLTTPYNNNHVNTVQVLGHYIQEHNYEASGALVNTNDAEILTNVVMPQEANTDDMKKAIISLYLEEDLQKASQEYYTIICN